VSRDPLDDAGVVVAYHETTLAELRGVFDQIDFDFRKALEREVGVHVELDAVDAELDAARAQLRLLGVEVATPPAHPGAQTEWLADLPTGRYTVPGVISSDDFGQIVSLAAERLEQLGIDLRRDPLLQLLPSSQIAQSLKAFADEQGEIEWSETDWAVVLGAGLIATLLDIVLVRIPTDATFLRKKYSGSPLTKWLQDKDRSSAIHARFFKQFECTAKVPYDASMTKATDGLVSKMRPATHRLQSLGHDPLLGFLFGVADIMRGTGTYIDGAGRLVQIPSVADPVELITALLTQVRHLLSDVYTPAGIPPPLFGLLQLGQVGTPLARGTVGSKVVWTDLARHMYTHGYDLRHSFTMGITPGVVSAIIRGYGLLNDYATDGPTANPRRNDAKNASMLLLGHMIATSGTLLKTGLVFGMNPAALNYNQILAMGPAAVAWLGESSARDRRIGLALDEEWRQLLIEP